MLEEKPSKAVDLLEASLLAKKSTFDAKESSPLVPIPVRGWVCRGRGGGGSGPPTCGAGRWADGRVGVVYARTRERSMWAVAHADGRFLRGGAWCTIRMGHHTCKAYCILAGAVR